MIDQKFVLKSLTLAVALLVAACGGGGSDAPQQAGGSVVLSGQVVDGPIAGALVCLLVDGVQARNAAGEAICSSVTDAQGNYTVTIPRSLATGYVTLVASKNDNIKLASSLGTVAQVLAAAGTTDQVTAAQMPAARVTHFTTADFSLADINSDGIVSKSEIDSYVRNFTEVRKVAAVIKAVIDFSAQSGSLIGGQTTNTLSLAFAAARNQPLGSSGQTVNQWFFDSANTNVIAAVDAEIVSDAQGFSNYLLSKTTTSSHVPQLVTSASGNESIFCGLGDDIKLEPFKVSLDATRRISVLKYTDDTGAPGQIIGSYNPTTEAISFSEIEPKMVVSTSASTPTSAAVTYYSEGSSSFTGTLNPATGNISGTFAEMSATTWTLNSTRQECTAQGTFIATKVQ